MDAILSSLSVAALRFVEDQLSNNEVASDEELHSAFISNGLTDTQATQALRYRSLYLTNMFLEGHTPILKNKHAIRINPESRQYELIRC